MVSDPKTAPEETFPMWSYWRDELGTASALTEHYSGLLENDPELRCALTLLRSAEALIDKIMQDRRA